MKKGQAAMEFLMTYGWAVLVVLATIGALAYFGVLSPSKHVPSTCLFQQGIACRDFEVDSDSIRILIQNGYAQDIMLYNFTVEGCDTVVINERLGDIDSRLIDVTGCSNGIEGDKMKADAMLYYSIAGSELIKSNKGEIISMVG